MEPDPGLQKLVDKALMSDRRRSFDQEHVDKLVSNLAKAPRELDDLRDSWYEGDPAHTFASVLRPVSGLKTF